MPKKDTKIIGNLGEDEAVIYLREKGYKILDQKLLLGIGEIDILAKDHKTLVIVEVKTVTGRKFGPAKGYVNIKKQEKLRYLAAKLSQLYPRINIRIDVIGIEYIGGELIFEHIENAVGGK